MKIPSYGPRSELKRVIVGFISLLGSSVISAVGFIIIASNRWVTFDPSDAVSLILFVQWQTLGLTIAKTGVEQVVFALVTENDTAYLDPSRYIFKKALPLAGIYSVVVLFVFSPWASCVAFCTILLDTWSLIIMADLNARQRFKTTAISNLFNYPLFFIIIFALNHFGRLNPAITLAVFMISSCLRWSWLWCNQTVRTGRHEVDCTANVQMGIQQALNYLLFRADQIVLALLGLAALHNENAPLYVFLAKFPELISAVMVIVATVLAKKIYLKFPLDLVSLRLKVRRYILLVPVYAATITALFYAYLQLWQGQVISSRLALPFLMNAIAILFAIIIIFSNLRQGHLQTLLRNYFISALVGLVLSLIVWRELNLVILAWLVPLQFTVFITISFALKWNNPKKLYERR